MPYNDAHSNAFNVNTPKLRNIELLPPPISQRITTIESAVAYISRLSVLYDEAPNKVTANELQRDLSERVELNQARQQLKNVYEGI